MPKITIEITGGGGELTIGTIDRVLFEKIEDYAYVRNMTPTDIISVWEDLLEATDKEIGNWYDIDNGVHVQGPILGSSELTLKVDDAVVMDHESTSVFNTTFAEDFVRFNDNGIYVRSMNEEQGQFLTLEFDCDDSFDLSKLVLCCDRIGHGQKEIEYDCFITGVEYDGEDLVYRYENNVTTKGFSIDVFNPYYKEEDIA